MSRFTSTGPNAGVENGDPNMLAPIIEAGPRRLLPIIRRRPNFNEEAGKNDISATHRVKINLEFMINPVQPQTAKRMELCILPRMITVSYNSIVVLRLEGGKICIVRRMQNIMMMMMSHAEPVIRLSRSQVNSSSGATRPRGDPRGSSGPLSFPPPTLKRALARSEWGRPLGGTSAWRPATVTGPAVGDTVISPFLVILPCGIGHVYG